MKKSERNIMKKIFSLVIAFVLFFSNVLLFESCKSVFPKNVSSSEEFYDATKGSVEKYYYYNPSSTDINITNDFTMKTGDDFFAFKLNSKAHLSDGRTLVKGIMLENMTLNGNGYTITIKGETNGSFGKYNKFLWNITNCTIKDLNIVYDLDFSIKGSDGSFFGGLVANSKDSTIENCSVTYSHNTDISFMTDSYGFHNSGFGGIVGSSINTTINNCKVNGKLLGTAGYFGGIAGTIDKDSIIKNSQFNGSIETKKMEECFAGGLAGSSAGSIYSSKVTADYFKFVGEPQGHRSRTSSCGGLVGKLTGKLNDCYININENGYLCVESIANGLFLTTVQAGGIVGETAEGSVVKNIYIDGSFDNVANIEYADPKREVKLGIFNNNSTSVSNIYFMDDNYYYNYDETFTGTREETESGYKFYGEIHDEDVVVEVICKSDYDDETDITTYDKTVTRSIILTIGNDVYNLERTNILTDSIYYGDTFDTHEYSVILDTMDQITYQIKVIKEIRFVSNGNVSFVSSYSDIEFELGENIIGGAEIYWKFDSNTNKPLLKSID